MSATPLLDAVERWLADGGNDPPPELRQLVDWPAMTRARRLNAVIAACASGAPAAIVRHHVVDRHGRTIPPPPPRPKGE